MVHALVDAQKPGDAFDVLAVVARLNARDVLRDIDVALCGQCRQQVELLEDEPDLLFAHPGARRVGKGGEIDAVDRHSAAIGVRQTSKNVEPVSYTHLTL